MDQQFSVTTVLSVSR